MLVLGVEPPELQHEFRDGSGLIGFADDWWERQRAVGEADGRVKLADPALTTEEAKAALVREKKREDRMRALAAALARWGWDESCDPHLLRPVLARIGVRPLERPPTLGDWAALARAARARRPRWSFVSSVSS